MTGLNAPTFIFSSDSGRREEGEAEDRQRADGPCSEPVAEMWAL